MAAVRRTTTCISAALFGLLLAACAPAPEAGDREHRESLYFDAELGFVMGHPADWVRVKSEATESANGIRWSPATPGGDGPVRATVTADPSARASTDREQSLSAYLTAHPGFNITSRESVDLAASGPALQVVGYTASGTCQVLFISSGRGGFTLEFCSPPGDFDRHRPLFEEMADSFVVVE